VYYNYHAVQLDGAIWFALVSGAVFFLFLGGKLRPKLFVVAALIIYLVLSPFTGQRYDVFFLLSSGIRLLDHVNPFDPGNPPAYPFVLKWAYPPLYPLYSALSFLVYSALTRYPIPPNSALNYAEINIYPYDVWKVFVPNTLPLLVFLLKLPMVASTFLVYRVLLKTNGRVAAAIYWLANPYVVFVTSVWGQLDPIAVACAVVAVVYYQRDKCFSAVFFAALGAAVKAWPAFLIPFFIVSRLKKQGVRALYPLLSAVPVAAASVVLYGLFGNALQSIYAFLYARSVPTVGGGFSVNGITWQQILYYLKSPPIPFFLWVWVPAYFLMCFQLYRRGGSIIRWVIVALLIFFLTYNYVNPQLLIWIIPFYLMLNRRLQASVFSLLPLIYIALTYSLYYFVSPTLLYDELSFPPAITEEVRTSAFVYSTPLFLAVVAVMPTAVYIVSLLYELKPGSFTRIHEFLKLAVSTIRQTLRHVFADG
jgi:Gpi18-like mannosyltransferase